MAVAFDKKRTSDFVTPQDKLLPADQQTTFILVQLSQDEFDEMQLHYAEIADAEAKTPGKVDPSMPRLRWAVRMALRGWKNFKMADGRDAPFNLDADGRPSDETLKLLHAQDLLSIFHEINKKESLTPAEAGKS